MTQLFQRLTKRHVNMLRVLIGLAVVFSILHGVGNAQLLFPPRVSSVSPAPGATGVSTGVSPRAVFIDVLDPGSLSASTVMLRDSANNQVSGTINWEPLAFAVSFTPQQPLQPGQTYTMTLKGGSAPHITNLLGLALPSNYVWSFTTAGPPPTPPQVLSVTPAAGATGISTGVAPRAVFSEALDAASVSASTVMLRDAANNLITASVSYSSSNFTVTLTPQQPLQPGQTYTVTLKGGSALPHITDATGTPLASNYVWSFTTAQPPPTPPQVLSVTPAAGATGISTGVAPRAVFSEALDSASVNASTVMLRDAANNLITASVSYSSSNFTVTLTPQQTLQTGKTYTMTLKGGSGLPHITDATGTPLASDYVWSFSTAEPPPSTPILVITSSGNKFTQYYQEILRAEGLNNFNAIDVTQVTEAALAQYDVAILGEMSLTSSQVTAFSNWVGAGGNLIAMRPDKQLASLLGISDAASVRSDAYLLVNSAQEPGAGIVNQTIQYHSAADLYTLAGATQVAAIFSSATQVTSNPAVTIRSVGANGGQAAAFTFDLARSIVYTRQGNPAWAGQERDGHPEAIRASDLYFPDYLNLDKVAIPQADELQRLLANMILYMNTDKRPLPRFWYFPNMKKAVILMTGDDHGSAASTQATFDMLNNASAPGCSVANWDCYRATSWMYTESGLTNEQALTYRNQGFEMGVHVNPGCQNFTPQSLDNAFTQDLATFAAKYTNLPAQKTNRTHCIPWSDWATQPKVELNHGVRLDENYYYYPPEWVQNRPGFMTGSGIPMRFADLDGSVIDVYQAPTHLVNENGVAYPEGINSMLDKALGSEGYYGVFGTHYDYRGDGFEQNLLNSAMARNVSLVSAQQLLTWLDGRNSSSFGNSTWNGTQLRFSITVGSGASNLYAMVPNQMPGGNLSSLTINGSPVAFTVETIKGRSYALFRAANGNAVATYAP
jgi:Big-like domain-containing protein